ncbi:30S ribosome-binding factor RbfA [uncultured Veillonella sp.]|uniref:30S ribosome-binding factor RbfA n=1 Tax=uncultured Veillonella sp. TaxID=159268 RepID=UPI002620AEC5|nr:30S ribosome-binding factor RbfA [uncultured Veillonella sp.]
MSDVRVRKLQEFIKQEVSSMLMRGLKDPRIGFVTVTDVEVTGDLRQATIYVSLFGSDEAKKESLQALRHATGHIRSELGKVLRLRYTPELAFEADTSLDYSMHIESLLHDIKKDEASHKVSDEQEAKGESSHETN